MVCAVVLAVAAAGALLAAPAASLGQSAAGPAMSGLRVSGNRIVNGAGQPVRLLGVNRSGTEYACAQGWGIFDGPSDAASVQAIAAWKATAVRVSLNEHCWFGLSGVNPAYSGLNYQNAIARYVSLLTSHGLAVILDLHWSSRNLQPALSQQPMPNRDYSILFWQQVATAYKNNSAVIFDLFNEPYPDSGQDTTAAWTCWRDGGSCPGVPYPAAGMQELVATVRSTGATNVIVANGVVWANSLTQWLTYRPVDPLGNLAAGWHVYNWNPCNTTACYDRTAGPVAAQVPLITSEIGENDCTHAFIDPLMDWLDSRQQSYLAWAWVVASCTADPSLIVDYNGTPTQTYGQGVRDRLARFAPPGPPAPTPVVPLPIGPNLTATPLPVAAPAAVAVTPLTAPAGGSVTATWAGILDPRALTGSACFPRRGRAATSTGST